MDVMRNPDMDLTCGIVRDDQTLKQIFAILNALPAKTGDELKSHLYMDELPEVVKAANNAQSYVQFKPVAQMPSLNGLCDVMVDCTRRNKPDGKNTENKLEDRYRSFKGIVLLQSEEYPRGRLISPPRIEPASTDTKEPHIFRQGDCVLSGTVPILAALEPIARSVRLNIVMQLGRPLNTFPTSQNIGGMYPRPDEALLVETQLVSLFPDLKPEVDSVVQIPSHDYYTATFTIEVERDITHKDVLKVLANKPRVRIAPSYVQNTSDVEQAMREPASLLGRDVSPLMVYSNLTSTRKKGDQTTIRLYSSIYSRCVAVLPNIDAARSLARGMDLPTAMRETDRHMQL